MFSYPTLSSTSTKAHELLRTHTPPFAVHADQQTHGYGQLGKGWESKTGNLYLTLALPLADLAHPPQLLPLRAAIALSQWIEVKWQIRVGLKWPNDLIYANCKLAGLLCETSVLENSLQPLLIGIGLNLYSPPEPESYAAISISEIIPLSEPVSDIARELVDAWTLYWDQTEEEIIHRYQHYQLGPGQLWRKEDRLFQDLGISSSGYLQLESLDAAKERVELVSAGSGFQWVCPTGNAN